MKTLGERIRELREERDISLRELARNIDCSAAFVSDIELGRRYPSDEVFVRIAQALEVEVEDLRHYDPRPPIEALKRLTESDPSYGIALRKIADKEVSLEEILDLLKRKDREKNQ